MAKKNAITREQLVAAYLEFEDVTGPEPVIQYDGDGKKKKPLSDEEFGKLFQQFALALVTDEDEFTPKTQKVLDYLNEKYGEEEEEEEEEEEAPAPKKQPAGKGKKAPVVEEDEDEDEEEDDDTEDEDEGEDEEEEVPVKKVKGKPAPKAPAKPEPKGKKKPVVEEEDEEEEEEEDEDDSDLSLIDAINAKGATKADLHEIVKGNPDVFDKKTAKKLLEIKSIFSLKKEMLALCPEVEDEDEEEAPAPKKKAAPAPAKKAAPAPTKKSRKVEVEEEDEDEEEEEEVPVKKGKAKPTVKELVEKAKDRDALLAIVKENKDVFDGIKTKAFDTHKKLQKMLVTFLGELEAKNSKGAKRKVEEAPKKKGGGSPAIAKVGITDYIIKSVVDSGEAGVSEERILKGLAKKFPDREVAGMKKTLGVTLRQKMVEKGYNITKNPKGLWYIAPKKKKK